MPIPAAIGALGKGIAGFLGGSGILGGLFGRSGASKQNKMNLQIAREQMAFQERMSNTAYQRAAQDLESAGLNRILAIGSPASSPQGAQQTMQNENAAGLEGAAIAMGLRNMKQDIANKKATHALIKEQESLTRNQANTAYEGMKLARAKNQYLFDGDVGSYGRSGGVNAANAQRLFESELSSNIAMAGMQSAQRQMYENMVPKTRVEGRYYDSRIGGALHNFSQGIGDIGPAIIGGVGAGASAAWFRRKAARQFERILGKGF
jgi:hypothetical protein